MWYFARLSLKAETLKSILRSWCLFVLGLSLLLTPQITLVHALSHTLANDVARDAPGEAHNEQHANNKACGQCLALAQLGTALATQFDWAASSGAALEWRTPVAQSLELRRSCAYRARAPPTALI